MKSRRRLQDAISPASPRGDIQKNDSEAYRSCAECSQKYA